MAGAAQPSQSSEGQVAGPRGHWGGGGGGGPGPGPLAALFRTLGTCGFLAALSAPDRWRDHHGRVWDAARMGWKLVARTHLQEAVWGHLVDRRDEYAGLEGPPVKGVFGTLRTAHKQGRMAEAGLRFTCLAAGTWTDARCAKAGFKASGACGHCGAPSGGRSPQVLGVSEVGAYKGVYRSPRPGGHG